VAAALELVDPPGCRNSIGHAGAVLGLPVVALGGLDDGGHVGAAAGDEDHDVFVHGLRDRPLVLPPTVQLGLSGLVVAVWTDKTERAC